MVGVEFERIEQDAAPFFDMAFAELETREVCAGRGIARLDSKSLCIRCARGIQLARGIIRHALHGEAGCPIWLVFLNPARHRQGVLNIAVAHMGSEQRERRGVVLGVDLDGFREGGHTLVVIAAA